MTTDPIFENPTFEKWELLARIAMADRQIRWDVADPLIADARLHWQASEQDPWSACGAPAEFAEAAAAEQPPDGRAEVDHQGLTARSYLTDTFFVLAVLAVPWSLIAAFLSGDWSFTLTPARLVGGVLFSLTFIVLFGLPRALRTSGRPRQAPWAMVPILALMGLTVAAFGHLPRTGLITVPVLGLVLASAAVVLLQLGPSKPTRSPSGSGSGDRDVDDEAWFRRLGGLLVGRHDLPPGRAADLVAQAREHQPSASAVQEFGRVELYAAEIAERETLREFPAWIRLDKLAFVLFCLVLCREQVVGRLDDPRAWLRLALMVIAAFLAVVGLAWVLVRRGRRTSRPVD